MKKTEDSYFVGLQGESDCSFWKSPNSICQRAFSPPLSVNPSAPFEHMREPTWKSSPSLNMEHSRSKQGGRGRKKLLGKTLSITKAQFTLCLAFPLPHLTRHMCFSNLVRLSACCAFSRWLWDIMRPELNRRPLSPQDYWWVSCHNKGGCVCHWSVKPCLEPLSSDNNIVKCHRSVRVFSLVQLRVLVTPLKRPPFPALKPDHKAQNSLLFLIHCVRHTGLASV